jgi:hypothetical protein
MLATLGRCPSQVKLGVPDGGSLAAIVHVNEHINGPSLLYFLAYYEHAVGPVQANRICKRKQN